MAQTEPQPQPQPQPASNLSASQQVWKLYHSPALQEQRAKALFAAVLHTVLQDQLRPHHRDLLWRLQPANTAETLSTFHLLRKAVHAASFVLSWHLLPDHAAVQGIIAAAAEAQIQHRRIILPSQVLRQFTSHCAAGCPPPYTAPLALCPNCNTVAYCGDTCSKHTAHTSVCCVVRTVNKPSTDRRCLKSQLESRPPEPPPPELPYLLAERVAHINSVPAAFLVSAPLPDIGTSALNLAVQQLTRIPLPCHPSTGVPPLDTSRRFVPLGAVTTYRMTRLRVTIQSSGALSNTPLVQRAATLQDREHGRRHPLAWYARELLVSHVTQAYSQHYPPKHVNAMIARGRLGANPGHRSRTTDIPPRVKSLWGTAYDFLDFPATYSMSDSAVAAAVHLCVAEDKALMNPMHGLLSVCARCAAEAVVGRCGACHWVAYCSEVCQQADWEHHKQFCGEIAARQPEVLPGKSGPEFAELSYSFADQALNPQRILEECAQFSVRLQWARTQMLQAQAQTEPQQPEHSQGSTAVTAQLASGQPTHTAPVAALTQRQVEQHPPAAPVDPASLSLIEAKAQQVQQAYQATWDELLAHEAQARETQQGFDAQMAATVKDICWPTAYTCPPLPVPPTADGTTPGSHPEQDRLQPTSCNITTTEAEQGLGAAAGSSAGVQDTSTPPAVIEDGPREAPASLYTESEDQAHLSTPAGAAGGLLESETGCSNSVGRVDAHQHRPAGSVHACGTERDAGATWHEISAPETLDPEMVAKALREMLAENPTVQRIAEVVMPDGPIEATDDKHLLGLQQLLIVACMLDEEDMAKVQV